MDNNVTVQVDLFEGPPITFVTNTVGLNNLQGIVNPPAEVPFFVALSDILTSTTKIVRTSNIAAITISAYEA